MSAWVLRNCDGHFMGQTMNRENNRQLKISERTEMGNDISVLKVGHKPWMLTCCRNLCATKVSPIL